MQERKKYELNAVGKFLAKFRIDSNQSKKEWAEKLGLTLSIVNKAESTSSIKIQDYIKLVQFHLYNYCKKTNQPSIYKEFLTVVIADGYDVTFIKSADSVYNAEDIVNVIFNLAFTVPNERTVNAMEETSKEQLVFDPTKQTLSGALTSLASSSVGYNVHNKVE